VFLLDRVDDQQDVLRCFDLNTGRELWKLAYDAPGTLPYNGSRNVPTVDEPCLFLLGPLGHFHCVDRRTHQIVWARHLVNDFKDPQVDISTPPTTREEKLARTQLPMWGLTQAPLLYRDLVIVAPQTQKTGLAAFEKSTGKIRWQSAYIGRNWYSHVSPFLTTLGGKDQIIMLAQPSDPEKSPAQAPPAIISSIDPDTGQILWTHMTPGPYKIPIAQPLRLAEDRLFITGGYGLGCLILQVSCVDSRWKAQVLFHKKTVAAHIHSPILYQDKIYVLSFKEHGGTSTGLVCLNREGDALWQTGPGQQFDFGPLLVADGLAFVMHGKTGELHLFDLSGNEAKLLAKAKVLTAHNNMVWAPMALAEGKLLVRDQHEMKCLDVKNP
jgi:outer membrane protein assembly factor BamB